ncbi:T9SS type A sorting domain-containing protein [Marivirga sp. S37H4]|uniref:T9SS type A sorting domain-containing protein n=1 Tax=Marivirga aurantiaca TaxID=2802615 RepID=A0A934WYC1_9BACT|nr:T9SS type A sorting domain-containing protein [Marivirga aurantiaca]MBK6265080.1 T9SS type A sorting domain-containing protein [Marivirga aurantiaca]
MRILLTSLFLISFLHYTFSQWEFQDFNNTSLNDINNEEKLFPWAGGLNGVQYSQMDLDNDGTVDIIAFDRSSGRIMCFLKKNNTYQYAPEYEPFFPNEISNFLIIKDYDQDGKSDIFTAGNLGITVFRNISTGKIPSWEKATDFITYESLSGNNVNLQVNFNDYPHIADIDEDGDLDIFNFNFSGLESKIIFYKNESVEQSGKASIDNFRAVDNFWGEVEDCDCGVFAFGEEECNSTLGKTEAHEAARHAGGKSILIYDFNEDGTFELITSHEECKELYAFTDSPQAGIFPTYSSFHSDFPNDQNPATFNFYPNAMLLDLNGDDQKEIIVSPNIESNFGSPVNFSHSNWLYESSTNGYTLTTKSFLQEDMIDWGFQASPAFYDIDADGDLDLFVAYTNLDETETLFSAIAHYENIGDSHNPEFEFITDNFLNIKSLGMANILMQWKDIDGDGLKDLSLQGTISNSNQLFFVYNNNGDFNLGQRQQITDISIGFGFSVHLADVVGSGSVDLLLGKSSGGLRLFENIGSGRNPVFTQIENEYLGIGDDFFQSSLKVYVEDLDNDGEDDLIASDLSGDIRIFPNVRNNEGSFDSLTLYNKLDQSYKSVNLGKRNNLTIAKLFNDDFPSIILGSVSGGLRIIRNVEEFPVTPPEGNKVFIVYPNPNSSGIFQINTNENVTISISTISGQRILQEFLFEVNAGNVINLSNLASGMYVVNAHFADGTKVVRKVVME